MNNMLKLMAADRFTNELARTCEDYHNGPNSAMHMLFRARLTSDFSAIPNDCEFFSLLDDECDECLQESKSDFVEHVQEYARKIMAFYKAAEKLEEALTEIWEHGANDMEVSNLYHAVNQAAKAKGGAA